MDLSAIMSGGMPGASAPGKQEKPAFEYTAQTASPAINGEAKLTINGNSFSAISTFDAAEVPYAEVNKIMFADYTVKVITDGGTYVFSRMGEWAERFYTALCDAYNKAVLRSMFVSGNPIVTANGDYSYIETGATGSGKAPVYVYDKSVVALPPDLSARRIPLCFVNAMDKGDYTLTLKTDAGENYTFSKLGYDTAPITDAIEKQKRTLLEKALQAIKKIDPTVQGAQASQLARHMQEGAAFPFGKIAVISPSFASALEEKISQTRAAEYYAALKQTCDPGLIYVGFRDTLFWLIAPSPNGQNATVEFSEADTATFVYKTSGNFEVFARQLNRALEAINFKREVIFMPDNDLRRPENADYFMAAKRTAALQFVRRNFADRVIHSSPEAWKSKLTEIYRG